MKKNNPILNTIFANKENLYEQVQTLLESGENPSERTEYFETPLRIFSRMGRFDIVQLLFENGADPSHLNWTDIFHVIAYGTVAQVKENLASNSDLLHRDTWERTPFLLAVQVGEVEKAQLVLNTGASLNEVGRWGTAVEYAIHSDSDKMLEWLIKEGVDTEKYNNFGYTPLIQAVEKDAVKCIKVLLNSGVDIFKRDRSQFSRKSAIAHSSNIEVVKLLTNAGEDICKNEDVRPALLGIGNQEYPNVTKKEYLNQKYRMFGQSNPELCTNNLWYENVQCVLGAWCIRDFFDDTKAMDDDPIWCYDRYGKSITAIGGDEYIEIGGEHEDHYAPDFCIYNEVVHFRAPGMFEIYMFPRAVFPPTDSHTATLVNDFIYIIGNLGYPEERAYGKTPVYRLNIKSFEIDNAPAKGDAPGWIYNHQASYDGRSTIIIRGGEVLDFENQKEVRTFNKHDYILNLENMEWTRQDSTPSSTEGRFFSEEYKDFRHSGGTLLSLELNKKWRLIKIINVHRIDVEKGQAVLINNERIVSPEEDFLFSVVYLRSEDFKSIEDLQLAVENNNWKLVDECKGVRTTYFDDSHRYVGFDNVTKKEKILFDQWRQKFERGEISIL